jgi:hypothetical protein
LDFSPRGIVASYVDDIVKRRGYGPVPGQSSISDGGSRLAICLWYDKDAEAAARFYADIFPDGAAGVIHRAPGRLSLLQAGRRPTVNFMVAGMPCIGLNGGPVFLPDRYGRSAGDRPLLE